MKLKYFRLYNDTSRDIFMEDILSVHQLHVYALLKFVLKSLGKHHKKSYRMRCFPFVEHRNKRGPQMRCVMEPKRNGQIEKAINL